VNIPINPIIDSTYGMNRAYSTYGEKVNACRALVGKPKGKRSLKRPRRRWIYNIKIDLREIEWDCMDWIYQPQDRSPDEDLRRRWKDTIKMDLGEMKWSVWTRFISLRIRVHMRALEVGGRIMLKWILEK
jgi:hypothetical protein